MTALDDPFARKSGEDKPASKKPSDSGDGNTKPTASRGAGPAVVVLVVLFILLPLIYVLAIGPIIWLNDRKVINVTPESPIAWIYAPLEYAHNKTKIVSVPLDWYLELWHRPDPPMTVPATPYAPPPPTAAPVPAVPTPGPAAPTTAPTQGSPAASAPAPIAAEGR